MEDLPEDGAECIMEFYTVISLTFGFSRKTPGLRTRERLACKMCIVASQLSPLRLTIAIQEQEHEEGRTKKHVPGCRSVLLPHFNHPKTCSTRPFQLWARALVP
jgi:hypothetical protein